MSYKMHKAMAFDTIINALQSINPAHLEVRYRGNSEEPESFYWVFAPKTCLRVIIERLDAPGGFKLKFRVESASTYTTPSAAQDHSYLLGAISAVVAALENIFKDTVLTSYEPIAEGSKQRLLSVASNIYRLACVSVSEECTDTDQAWDALREAYETSYEVSGFKHYNSLPDSPEDVPADYFDSE